MCVSVHLKEQIPLVPWGSGWYRRIENSALGRNGQKLTLKLAKSYSKTLGQISKILFWSLLRDEWFLGHP